MSADRERPSASYANGAAKTRSSRPPPPIGMVVPARDPMLKVLAIGKKNDAWVPGSVVMSALVQTAFFASVVVATQWGLAAYAHEVSAEVRARLNTEYEIEVKEDPPPPPPPPAPEKEEPKPETPPPAAHVQAPPVAPQLAQAAHVLTKQEEPEKIEDMTDKFLDGTGNGGGGQTGMSGGQGFGFGNNPNPAPPSTGTVIAPAPPPPPPPPTVDRSRPAGRQGASQWNCPWPPEADAAQIDEAYVTVTVMVKPDGGPASVNVTNEPGYGFGRYARQCAMQKRYTPALDRDGNPIGGTTPAFRIHFSR